MRTLAQLPPPGSTSRLPVPTRVAISAALAFEHLHLGARQVVLGQRRDRIEQLRAARVVEELRRDVARSPPQAGEHLRGEVGGRGVQVVELDRRMGHCQCAGPEAGEDVVAVGPVVVAPGVADQPAAGRPAAPAQHAGRAEQRLRVVLVHVGREARVGAEHRVGPLPGVADHLPAAEGAVARRQRADVDGAERAAVEVGERRRRRRVAPGVTALARGERAAVRGRLARRGHLPLELGGQPPACPAAAGLRLVPAHVDDRGVRRQRFPAVEAAQLPAVAAAPPVDRVLEPRARRARPSPPRPRSRAGGSRRRRRTRRTRRCSPPRGRCGTAGPRRVRPLLVVEAEAVVGLRAEQEFPAGNRDVTGAARPPPRRVRRRADGRRSGRPASGACR